MCAIWLLTRDGTGRVVRAVGLFGRESLPVYYWHLIMVYGKDFEWSFIRLFPDGLGYMASLGVVIGLVLLMYLVARGWSTAKKGYPRVAVWCVRGVVVGSVATFLLS